MPNWLMILAQRFFFLSREQGINVAVLGMHEWHSTISKSLQFVSSNLLDNVNWPP